MKNLIKFINFVTTVPYNKHKLCMIWWRQSLLVTFLTCISITTFQLLQYHQKQQLTSQLNNIESRIADKQQKLAPFYQAQQDKEVLHKPSNKIHLYAHRLKNQRELFNNIQTITTDSYAIDSIKINKKQCEITGTCPSTEQTYSLCSRLQTLSLLTNAHVVGMQYAQDGQVQYRIKT